MMPRAGLTFGTKNPEWKQKTEPYLAALRESGLEPVLLLPGVEDRNLQGLVIGGGTDIDPALYRATRHAETEDPDPPRDQHELSLLRAWLDADLPVLAICRGLQMFHIAHGGTLNQHIDGHRAAGVADAHAIEVARGSRLHQITGLDRFAVNTRHHQAAGEGPRLLTVSARATDGTIEGLERPDRFFALAVQWHPEDRVRTHAPDRALFAAFARACADARR